MHALAATVPLITTCPHCSRLVDGTCVVCEDGETHPSCHDCISGRLTPPLWRNEFLITIATTVVVTVLSGLIVAKLTHRR